MAVPEQHRRVDDIAALPSQRTPRVVATPVMRLMGALAVVFLAHSADAQVAQEPPSSPSRAQESEGRREPVFSLRKQPSVRIGPLRLDVRTKSEAHWRDASDEDGASSQKPFELRRARLGIEGRVTRYVEYQVERELRDEKRPWRDVFVDIRPVRGIRVQAGRFKMPFSLDQTTGVADGSFVYRSLAASVLAPSRDVGAMAYGGLLSNAVRYEGGVFRRGGDNARVVDQDDLVSERTIAGRVVTRPWNAAQSSLRSLRSLSIGAAFTVGRVPEGLNSLRAESVTGERLVDPIYVNGLRRRFGAEAQWRPGSVSVQGEFMRASDQRRLQGIDNDDLPDAVQRGWYLSGTWLFTGEQKKDNVKPARPLFQGGFGALELAGRLESLTFGGGFSTDVPLSGPRARRIPEQSDAAWTLGLNWYLNELLKVQLNAIRERREAEIVAPAPERTWTRALRIQFQL